MAITNILAVGQSFLLNNSLKCLNILKKDYSIKKVVDPGLIPPKPKKPISPYVSFQMHKRNEVIANNPGKSFKEISKLLAAEWRSLSEFEKNKYRENFMEKHALYKSQLLEYNENYGELIEGNNKLNKMVTSCKEEKRQRKKMQIQNNKPQFPTTAYRLFIQENITKLGLTELPGVARLKKCAEMWSNMSEAEKGNFKKMHQERFKQYKKELSIWEENMIQEGKHHLVRPNTIKKKLSEE